MQPPKAFVLRTAGTNCDGETAWALERAGARAELLHLQRLAAEPARLDEAALVVLPGGFSYGDDVAAGRVFGLELRHLLHEALAAFVDRGGFVLGICNGFQVLVEAGLLEREPGRPVSATERTIALTGNASNRFECRWVALSSEDSACPWLVPGEVWPVPVAHAEGRFVTRDAAVLERLAARRQIALRYAPAPTSTSSKSRGSGPLAYPDNPNGSEGDIAGVCDPSGRVLGLMPHPERNVNPWNHPFWTRLAARDEGEGLAFFRRMVDAAACTTPV